MKKINLFILLIILINTDSYSQNTTFKKERTLKSISFNTGLGYAGYDINSLKSSFALIPNQLDFPAKVTDNFPNIPYISGEFLFDFKDFSFGLFYDDILTGGRIAYSDYSGEYNLDSRISSSTLGFIVFIKLDENEYFDYGVNLKGGFCNVTNEVSETITIQNISNTVKSSISYDHFNLEIDGRLNFYYSIFKVGLDVGFLTEIKNRTNVSWIGGRYSLNLGIRYKFD